jgi:UDP-N-acetylglucosamine 2-epimerase (non-hydrolysing)
MMVVAGTRPEAIKIAPVLWWMDRLGVEYIFVWSGQHYDYEISRVFFDQLKLPEPNKYLETVQMAHDVSEQVTVMIRELTSLAKNIDPKFIYALGDTNTTLSAALASVYANRPFIHDEAGMRSFDLLMLEEINRRIADAISFFRLAPTKISMLNLLYEGFSLNTIRLVGSTVIDTLLYILRNNLTNDKILTELSLEPGRFILATLHRRENLSSTRLNKIISILVTLATSLSEYTIVIPLHPHTKKRLIDLGLMNTLMALNGVKLTKPLDYFSFISLMKNSIIVLTDSGGVQEEAFILGKKILTLRKITEWPETVLLGYNHLVDIDKVDVSHLVSFIRSLIDSKEKEAIDLSTCPLGDGKAGWRVAKILKNIVETDALRKNVEPRDINLYPIPKLVKISKDILKYPITLCFDRETPIITLREIENADNMSTCVMRESILNNEKLITRLTKTDWASVDID